MDELVEKAKVLIQKKYLAPYHTVAAVIVTKDGREYSAINTDHFTGYSCAEASALSNALYEGVTEFSKVVAVGKNSSDNFDVINPCGKCRQLLHDFAPGISVIVVCDDESTKKIVSIDELLPYAFKRRQDKIRKMRRGELVQ